LPVLISATLETSGSLSSICTTIPGHPTEFVEQLRSMKYVLSMLGNDSEDVKSLIQCCYEICEDFKTKLLDAVNTKGFAEWPSFKCAWGDTTEVLQRLQSKTTLLVLKKLPHLRGTLSTGLRIVLLEAINDVANYEISKFRDIFEFMSQEIPPDEMVSVKLSTPFSAGLHI
jgi:hypothetical protein